MEFMGRSRYEVDLQFVEVVYVMPHGLHGIGVKNGLVLLTERRYVFDVGDGADFVVGVHQGYKRAGVFLEQLFELMQVYIPLTIDSEETKPNDTVFFEFFQRMQHGMVFQG